MGARHFSPKLFRFLAELERHNDRAWFQRNRTRYLEDVRDPMLAFISDFGPRLRRISRHLVADPRPAGGSMFRIHRDTRFSKDKRPYKTNAGAQFRHAQARDVHSPGCYLHLGAGEVFAAAGVWHPDGHSLRKIREAIAGGPARWRRVLSGPAFGKGRLELGGASLKRPPRGFDPDHPSIEDLKRTDFYVWKKLTRRDVCAPGFIDRYADLCRDALPFMRFLARAMELPL